MGALTAEITGTNIQIDAKNDILNIGAVIAAKKCCINSRGNNKQYNNWGTGNRT